MGVVNVQVAPVPVFEYKLHQILDQDDLGRFIPKELASEDLTAIGAEGWSVAGVVLNGTHILFGRQVAVRLIPVEEPTVLGASNQLRLARAGPGNGR
jgi:hypothetical protein